MVAERHGYSKEHHPRSAVSSAFSMRRSQSAPRLRHGAQDGAGGREGVPYVSERSRRLAERRRSGPADAHARLYEEAGDLEARRRHLRALEEAKEAASLTPGPSVSATSRKYLELRHESSDQPVSERLYTDGLRQRRQREAAAKEAALRLDPEATFQPSVSKSSELLLSATGHEADPWRRPESFKVAANGAYASADDSAGGGVEGTGGAERGRPSGGGGGGGSGRPSGGGGGGGGGSGRLTSSGLRESGGISIWDVQHLEAHQRRAERLMLQALYDMDTAREHSYQPTITAASRALASRTRRSASAPPSRRYLAPRVEAPRGSMPIHHSLFEDAKLKQRHVSTVEHEREAEIAALARSHSARKLRPQALDRLCYAHRQKAVEMEALREYVSIEIEIGIGIEIEIEIEIEMEALREYV
jgi:hypothetical protein